MTISLNVIVLFGNMISLIVKALFVPIPRHILISNFSRATKKFSKIFFVQKKKIKMKTNFEFVFQNCF